MARTKTALNEEALKHLSDVYDYLIYYELEKLNEADWAIKKIDELFNQCPKLNNAIELLKIKINKLKTEAYPTDEYFDPKGVAQRYEREFVFFNNRIEENSRIPCYFKRQLAKNFLDNMNGLSNSIWVPPLQSSKTREKYQEHMKNVIVKNRDVYNDYSKKVPGFLIQHLFKNEFYSDDLKVQFLLDKNYKKIAEIVQPLPEGKHTEAQFKINMIVMYIILANYYKLGIEARLDSWKKLKQDRRIASVISKYRKEGGQKNFSSIKQILNDMNELFRI